MSHHDPHLDGFPAPLPGTAPPTRAIFVDRAGTLIQPHTGSAKTQYKEFEFAEGAVDALFRCNQAGWTIYLIGNESAIARGTCPKKDWVKYESEMLAALKEQGVEVKRCYACLTDPIHGKGKLQMDSVFLLPNTGAMYHAKQHDGITLEGSWVIGDSALELAAGWRAGCRTAGIEGEEPLSEDELQTNPEFVAETLVEALDHIMQMETASQS